MRIYWFHLMPYRELPPTFSQDVHSVWVDVPQHYFESEKVNRFYNDYLDELEFADRMGFDGICVNEHHQNAYGMMPSPNIMAATLARRTENAALVVLGTNIALYNPPIRAAEEYAMIDCISGGRMVAGFPVGTSQDTNFCYGTPPAQLREKYYEAHDLILKAWQETEPFALNGKFTKLRYVNLSPKPIQKPHPPIWIPGGGSIETWRWCAEHAYVYYYLSFTGYQRGARTMNGYWQTLQDMGIERNPYRGGFLQLVCVGETDEDARKTYEEAVHYFYDKCLHIYPGYSEAPGYRTVKSIEAGFQSPFLRSNLGAWRDMRWDDFVEQGYIIAGSPASVAAQIKNAAETVNVGHLMMLQQVGNLSHERTLRATEIFAQKVLPEVRNQWSEWEDHWYPAPLAQRARASQPAVAL